MADVTLDEMFEEDQEEETTGEQTSEQPSVVSLEEMGLEPAQGPPPSSVLQLIYSGSGAKKYVDDYVKLSNEYAKSLSEDVQANPVGMAAQLLQSGKTVLHALGAVFSPAESAARTGIIQPVQEVIDKISGLAIDRLAAEDTYNAQERREAFLAGKPIDRQYPKGIDLKVHKEDVLQATKGLNELVETGVLAGLGMVGGKPSPVMPIEAKLGKSVINSLDEIAITEPKTLEVLKNTVKDSDPELSSLLDDALAKAKKKNPVDAGIEVAKQTEPVKKPEPPPYRLEDAGDGKVQVVHRGGKRFPPTADRTEAKLQLDKLNDLAEQNAKLRMELDKLKVSVEGASNSVEQGMKVLADIPNAPKVELPPGETRETSLKKANRAYTEQAKKFLEEDDPSFKLQELMKPMEIHQAGLNIPGFDFVLGKLTEYYNQIIRTVNPEAMGQGAKVAASTLAKHIALQMQHDSAFVHKAADRIKYWNEQLRDPKAVTDFLDHYITGARFTDRVKQIAADNYRRWNNSLGQQYSALGIKLDNSVPIMFKEPEKVKEYLRATFGKKWADPQVTKDKALEMYHSAVKAGNKPIFDNPEHLMLIRQHAFEVAQLRVNALREMVNQGIALPTKGNARPAGWKRWSAPNGESYWVHDSADAVLHNAFNTQSLWSLPGLGGDLFRGAMFLKNATVPVKLALSLFHPLHVATIDNATGMVRASKGLLSGKISIAQFVKEMVKAGAYTDLAKETGGQIGTLFGMQPHGGYRLLRAYQGRLSSAQITPADQQALQFMAEGGFIPEMAAQYKTNSIVKLQEAIARRSATAIWHLPFAAISALQRPMFEIWIPSLKIASYLKDVKTALRTDPSLLQNPTKRQVTFRQLAKSVDNRYGEMAYNTLFWNRWVKDLAVANTLSLGWQMGFLREYGGGAMDLARVPVTKGSFREKIARGELDRPLFVSYYTAQALAYGGLLTWALSGEQPQGLNDYVYPRTGEMTPEGRPERVNTMFYPREFASIYHHVEKEGLVGGLGHLASSKASGVVGLTSEWARGVNDFGEEVRDPDAPAFKQLEQQLASTMEELQPISIGAIRESTSEFRTRSALLNLSGFSPAPKYVTETKTEGLIKGTFRKYFTHTQTPYDKAEFSDDRRKLSKAFEAGDSETYSTVMEKMQEKFDLTGTEIRRLERSLAKGEDPLLKMFSRLTWRQQKKILDQMTEEEREAYLPHSNKEHLRYSYEPPEEVK
jgi:hypothetical protein